MLNINNKNDIPKMMQYHRTKDMINLLTYFPELSPIKDLTIVTSIEDYKANYKFCKNLPCERNDTLISKPFMKSVESRGANYGIINIFKKVKEIDSEGVIVLFNLTHKPSERYDRYAGLSIGISLGSCVFIDAVGKGFDGREVSKGICYHEQYYIPWFDLRKLNVDNFKDYRTYLINQEEYEASRLDRINFLLSIGYAKERIVKYIPENYSEIPNFIWMDVIKNLLKKLEKMEEELKSAGFTEFAISGYTEGKKFMPWQIFDKSRYILARR